MLLNIQKIIQSITRAIKAEEKQGHINTGAIGSFSDYVLEVLQGLKDGIPSEIIYQMKCLAQDYAQSSPLKRRALLIELKQILNASDFSIHPITPIELAKEKKRSVQEQQALNNQNQTTQDTLAIPRIDQEDHDQREGTTVKETYGSLECERNLQYVKGVGPFRVKQFENLGIYTIKDLLRHFPRRYEFRTRKKIEELQDGELATINGTVAGSQVSRGRTKVIKLHIVQDGKSIYAIWFNQVHIAKQFPVGTEVAVTGKVQWNKRIPELLASDIVKGGASGPLQEIIPIYSETARLNSKTIRSIVKTVSDQIQSIFPEVLPEEKDLMKRTEAYHAIHFPSSAEQIQKAHARLVVEEVLFLQLALSRLRSPSEVKASPVIKEGGELVKRFVSCLPFKLTEAQRRVIGEIFRDMAQDKGMTRLVQGDVGSGKTVVAMTAILKSVGSDYQAAMMAPTEILAGQHFENLRIAFEPLGVRVVLLTGSQSKSEKERILSQIYSGKVHVVVGTHALIQETVRFNSLGLVVTDEQHRFGVRQRTLLEDKGENPHVLVMTATPIPRTLALTLYGDLQLSVINELPAGRKPIITKKITERNRPSLEKFLEQQMAVGRQIYVVCPLVEDTEKSDLVSATQTAEILKERFPAKKIALLHGRIKGQEKELIMQEFRKGQIDILVSTTVVEVGVNVPNASVMVVEDAERFGLAQLHQLRGRVGRGSAQSYCILISNVKDSARLNILCSTEDGFKIAEEDLIIRGPGELLGLRQHGVPELKITDLSRDSIYVEKAYRILQKVLASPGEYEKLYQEVEKLYPKDKIGVN